MSGCCCEDPASSGGECCGLADTLAVGDSAEGRVINQLGNLQFVASDDSGEPVTEGFSFTKVLRWTTKTDDPVLVPIISHAHMLTLLGGMPANFEGFQVAVFINLTRTRPSGSTLATIEAMQGMTAFRVKSDGVDLFFEVLDALAGVETGSLLLNNVNLDPTTGDTVSLIADPEGGFTYLWAAEIRLVSTTIGSTV